MSSYIKVGAGDSTSIGAAIMKTGATTSFRTNDDGDLERGRGTDWYTLPLDKNGVQKLNPFGNNKRFTGLTGGYQIGGINYNKDGGTTTAALAFPNDIVLDWSTDTDTPSGTKVIGIRRTISYDNYVNTETSYAALNIGGYTGWFIPNLGEGLNFALKNGSSSFNYNPLNISSGVNFHTSTLASSTVAYAITNTSFSVIGDFISNAKGCFPLRVFTRNGTTLT